MWLITHLPSFLFSFFFKFLHLLRRMRKREKRRSRSAGRRMRAKEEVLGLGGMHHCCRPLYLYNCTSCFIGFREVLCVSFAAGPGISGGS